MSLFSLALLDIHLRYIAKLYLVYRFICVPYIQNN